jgi:nucleoside-diphosphate-sugar epimerase
MTNTWVGIHHAVSCYQHAARIFGPIPENIRRGLEGRPPKMLFWVTGTPRREFLHGDDMAAARLLVMRMSDEQYGEICGVA